MATEKIATMPFRDAAPYWLSLREHELAPRTYTFYNYLIPNLTEHFGNIVLSKIRLDDIRKYQKKRRADAEERGVKDKCRVPINHEVGLLRQMLFQIGRWDKFKPFYRPILKERNYKEKGRAAEHEELELLLELFRSERKQETVKGRGLAARICTIQLNSTAGPNEMKSLTLGDIHLDADEPWFHIPLRGAKRERRERDIPLLGEDLDCMQELVDRAYDKCGCHDQDHFLLPFQNRDKTFDPTRPMVTYRTPLVGMLRQCGISMRPYDMRHTAITNLLRNPDVSEQTAEHYAGWISPEMKRKYSHARMKDLRRASPALDTRQWDRSRPEEDFHKPVRNCQRMNRKRTA